MVLAIIALITSIKARHRLSSTDKDRKTTTIAIFLSAVALSLSVFILLIMTPWLAGM
jgi:hypothetical protein